MPQLDATWYPSQIFWLLVTFVAFYFIMSRLVLPPLMHIVAFRKQTLDEDVAQAERMKAQAEQARADYERTLAEARNRVRQLMAESEATHKASAEATAKEMDQQIENAMEEAERRISARKQELINGLTPTVTELASTIVEKLTQKKPEASRVSRIMNELAKAGR